MKKIKVKFPKNNKECVRPFIFDVSWFENGISNSYRLYGFRELFDFFIHDERIPF